MSDSQDNKIQEGDKVSWKWGGANPDGVAAEVKAGEVAVTSQRGNEIKKTGDESDPAVHIERSGNDVVKLASELEVEKGEKREKTIGESKTGEKNEEANGKFNDHAEKAESTKQEDTKKEGDQIKGSEEKIEEKKSEGTDTTVEKNDKKEEDVEMKDVEDKVVVKKSEEQKPEETANDEAKNGKEDEKKDLSDKQNKSETKPQIGEKRKRNETPELDAKVEKEERATKMQRLSNPSNGTSNGTAEKKKPGRPKGSSTSNGTPKNKEKKLPAVGRAQRKTRSQARNEAS